MRFPRLLALCPLLVLTGCPSTSTPGDASDANLDAALDGSPDGSGDGSANDGANEAATEGGTVCTEVIPIHSLYPGPLYIPAGGSQPVKLRLQRDRGCTATYTITSGDTSKVTAPATVSIDRFGGHADFTVNGLAAGSTTLTVTQVVLGPDGQPTDAGAPPSTSINVQVMPTTVPACPTNTAAATGALTGGSRVSGAAGTALESASVTVPATVADVNIPDFRIECAADQLPAGYTAIGPAVRFSPGATRFPREMAMTVPINPALVPSMYQLHVELAYTGPSYGTPRIVPVANVRFTPDGKALYFEALKLGTYQPVIQTGLGTRHSTRHYNYHGILGLSMGALGTSMIATRHPELFDFAAPLGGPADWGWFMDYARKYLLGGFCTWEQRMTLGDTVCGHASNDFTPPITDLFMVRENFEFFYFPDGWGGTGGTFGRDAYTDIFNDLSHLFHTPAMQFDPSNGVLPLGVPASELARTDADRCATPVVLNRYYDDEFNPDGTYPVITFCDGTRTAAHAGEFPGGQGNKPFEATLAVDYNGNGVRDFGEPVIRNGTEPFDDLGTDNLASVNEPGYDPVTNPDPSGDDYDRQYNPGGTEGNHLHEEGEAYQDVGLDGIVCPDATCPYDTGEGNGQFDVNGGIARFLELNPRNNFAHLPRADAHRLSIWADGGVRDVLNLAASGNNFMGAVAQQGEHLHYWNNFSSLVTGGPLPASDANFASSEVDWQHVPDHSLLRYGYLDASMDDLVAGDGGHVGTADQATNRAFSALWWAQSRWPNGDTFIRQFSSIADNEGHCANGYYCLFDFTSPTTGRTGPLAIVLPPGYHRAENANERYPVLFMLHGYGMDPQGLAATGLLIGQQMASGAIAEWQRPAKYILVFPDGKCRPGDNCPQGTFYVDSANPNIVQMETYFLDVYNYVNQTFRVRQAEDVDVVE